MLSFLPAQLSDVNAIVTLRNTVAADLTKKFGKGHWSYETSERSVSSNMTQHSKIFLAKNHKTIIGTVRLMTKKPWAIDIKYFTEVTQPLYLVDMAVHPAYQRKGVGSFLLQQATTVAEQWPAQAIRLDAYDHAAGAGDFYFKSGYKEKGRVIYRYTPLIYFEKLLINT